ncbi:cytochrome b N-terminal domain-containing protein [Chamaesiphon sp. OTE_75_metabat_556]|uniref:cytochrome b N-terminal domain-containing protein n=1 Tax=Chamaesiphon sp. OTE_75_metabat_556 TaxID=2964692 RepID=UPI00286D0159|nr:cytochrome b N-terminal domain-containing protein [Chamaesiphon sp. OTE_75_metabat_556]
MTYNVLLRKLATILAIAIFTLCLVAAITGVAIAFYYTPSAADANASIEYINDRVANGWLIVSLHDIAGNGLIAVSLVQIVVMFFERQLVLSWIVSWVSGIFLTLSAIGLGWTAMNLDWSQLGYWRLKIELSTIEVIPVVGQALRRLLVGGEGLGTISLEHLFTIHSYLLSAVALGLSIVHLVSVSIDSQAVDRGEIPSEQS